MQLQH